MCLSSTESTSLISCWMKLGARNRSTCSDQYWEYSTKDVGERIKGGAVSDDRSPFNLDETGNVGTHDERWQGVLVGLCAVGNSSFVAGIEAVDHDVLELLVDFLGTPLDSLRVLCHLQTRNSNTTTVSCLTWSVPDTVANGRSALSLGLENVNGLLSRAHVRSLSKVFASNSDQSLGFLARDLVLGSTWQSDIDLTGVNPWSGTVDVLDRGGFESGVLTNDVLQRHELDLGLDDGLDVLLGDSRLADDAALRVGKRNNGSSKLDDLQSGVLSNVTGSRDSNSFASKRLLTVGGLLDHLLDVVDQTVTGSLWSDQRTTPGQSLTGQHTLELVLHLLVGTEHESDLTSGGTNVTSWNIGELANVSGKLSDEGSAESSDLVVALSLRVKVRSTLTTSHRETGQGVLENLLVSKEFEDRKVNTWVQSQTSLVWTQSRVELDSVTSVDLDIALVVLPGDSELDDSLWNRDNRNHLLVFWVLLEQSRLLEGGVQFVEGLLEFWLLWLDHCVYYGERAGIAAQPLFILPLSSWLFLEPHPKISVDGDLCEKLSMD
ncbi:hypothetical protein OGATHE_002404 [Ogataea polymorpha]|uniref:Uncharacterized protein n=1 Tax=Ogataea polymorpha TaxID=460523 RepID=A0A9P8PD02_9ASCO|nr:hypothetical protein OGATHE_002404 [Ogataea polymorpha]